MLVKQSEPRRLVFRILLLTHCYEIEDNLWLKNILNKYFFHNKIQFSEPDNIPNLNRVEGT